METSPPSPPSAAPGAAPTRLGFPRNRPQQHPNASHAAQEHSKEQGHAGGFGAGGPAQPPAPHPATVPLLGGGKLGLRGQALRGCSNRGAGSGERIPSPGTTRRCCCRRLQAHPFRDSFKVSLYLRHRFCSHASALKYPGSQRNILKTGRCGAPCRSLGTFRIIAGGLQRTQTPQLL